MNTLTVVILIVIAASAAIWLIRRTRPAPLNPFQTIFQNAIDHITEFGLFQHGFTPRGVTGIGLGIPHCVSAAVAAFDPQYDPHQSLYQTHAGQHLRAAAYRHFGVPTETVNDDLGLDHALALLRFCIRDGSTSPY